MALGTAHAQQAVSVPSLELRGGQPIPLVAQWFAAGGTGQKPVIVMLHGCGGPYNGKGQLSVRTKDYAALFNQAGWHALMLDSLTPRGEKELCTQKNGTRAVTMSNRRLDALGALEWLAQRPDVDARRLVLLGWSNGGSTVLAASNLTVDAVRAAPVRPKALVAFYPGCESDLKRGYAPSAPLLMLVGALDDWTPPQPCQALAEASAEPRPLIGVMPGAYHGFDGEAPLRLRTDVPNGVHPGQGVHVGGNPQARLRSREQLMAFLNAQLQSAP
nr:dienelactone hydrolase family protein [uncultured Roseateles sp.]